jgi:ketosteroid isomerase-like protein
VRKKAAALAMLCLLSLLSRAQDAAERDAGSKILALESVWNQAEENGNVAALDLIFDNSMIYIGEDGALLTKAQFLNQVAKEAGTELQWLVTPTISVHVYGNTAVVVGSYHVKGVRRGKPYQRDGRFIDTWAFKKGVWVCVVAQATPILR